MRQFIPFNKLCAHQQSPLLLSGIRHFMNSLQTMHLDLGITQLRKCTDEKIKALETLLQEKLMMEI